METPIKNTIAVAKTQERFVSNAVLLQQASIRIKKTLASIEAAQILSEKAQMLIEGSTEAARAQFPDLNSIPEFKEKFAREIDYYVRLVQYCLIAGDRSPIDESKIASADATASAFILPASAAISALQYIKAHHGLTEQAALETDTYIDCAIEAVAKLAGPGDKADTISDGPDEGTGEILTLEEIYKQYPNEWVLIASPELDEELNVIRGKVLAHSRERDETYGQLSLRKGQPVAIEYTGTAENLAIMF